MVKVATERDLTEFTVKLVRKYNDTLDYGFVIHEISKENYRSLLHIIYDREPTLPKKISKERLSIYYLLLNINNRIKKYVIN